MFETIETQLNGRIASIRITRVKQLNALNTQVMEEVLEAATQFAASPDVGCLVLKSGERAFAAGADIKELASQTHSSMQASNFFAGWDTFAALRIPKVAAVHGYALGGGCELAMMCDVIIASDTAKFGQPELKIGCIPGIGGTQRLTRLVGRACAMDMILTGRMVEADEALRMGLVSRVVAEDDLEVAANSIAETIASYPSDIVQMARDCVNMAENSTLESGMRHERQTYHALYGLPAQSEGIAAFLEKRQPNFQVDIG